MSNNQDISLSLKEIVAGQINNLLLLTRDINQSYPLLVHELRKGLKRTRAIFRLFKPVINDIDFHKLNKTISETGYLLTNERETYVNLQTFNELANNLSDKLKPQTINYISDFLHKQFDEAYSNAENELNIKITNIGFHLSKIRDGINNIKVITYHPDLFFLAIEKSFEKTQQLFTDCKISLHIHAVHKWRRHCKFLLFQLQYSPLLSNSIDKQHTEKLDSLTDDLGKDHDLAVFSELIKISVARNIDKQDFNIINQYLDKERDTLQKKAFKTGKEIFSKQYVLSNNEPVLVQ